MNRGEESELDRKIKTRQLRYFCKNDRIRCYFSYSELTEKAYIIHYYYKDIDPLEV